MLRKRFKEHVLDLVADRCNAGQTEEVNMEAISGKAGQAYMGKVCSADAALADECNSWQIESLY